jgi:flagellar hook-length control protein FliK
VREIQVVTSQAGGKAVEVEMNSRTLEGLRVRIAQDGDRLTVKFSTGSQAISQLLSRHLDQLSQALETKGFHVAPIQVQLRPPGTASAESGSRPADRRRDQGGDRQQKRQR